ncbi:hypothetical protein BDQ12DRAFT_706608 [Crucibulum laeve]|uniref:Leucine-rich repeat-containing protein 40 n=1 Tax=Crucibulum laeve TaxID=68775 RepID=A0A5C3LU90_9AGAR|nr:hypothetical protein BDQ12DRAFT_706608 [Crucibulum laeve]
MSRIPQPSSSRTPLKTPTTPSKSRIATSNTPAVRVRTQSTARATTPSKPRPAVPPQDAQTATASLSIKEAIALRRAEAKKAQVKVGSGGLDNFANVEDALPTTEEKPEGEDILGRLSVRETIERARSTGSLNLATRSLVCLPSALFEIHLGITPDSLKSVTNEPPLPAAAESPTGARRGKRDSPAWFEAQDLTVIKAWNNDITEIQHEISLFGSLKTIDLHKNKITSLPGSFANLTALTVLDLSHNALTQLPTNIFMLPELVTLNISHNSLTSLSFNAPFASSERNAVSSQYASSDFFTPAIVRATTPLPRLITLDASNNKILAKAIDVVLPASLTKFDLSNNPLGSCQPLLKALAALKRLRELRLEKADIGDESLPPAIFSSTPFPSLRILDLGETRVSPEAVRAALQGMKQEMNYDFIAEEPPEGVVRILVGKKVLKEYWELELEKRSKSRTEKSADYGSDWVPLPGLSLPSTHSTVQKPKTASTAPKAEIVKEAWEIEAEQGLLTEGGKRRARAAAAAAAAEEQAKAAALTVGAPSTPSSSPPATSSALSLNSPQYYNKTTQTLTLPPSAAPSKAPGHARAFSLAAPSASAFASPRTSDIVVPAPTLPLSIIITQPFAATLKVLSLVNRRMDRSFSIPPLPDGPISFLPNLEELNLEGCNFTDLVTVQHSDSTSGASTPPRSSELILPLITKLFPSLRTLNLSYNQLTSSSLAPGALSGLILSTPERKGLRHLRLRGNRLSELEGFLELACLFKGNREVPGWKLEELDLRDNEIGKLPAELGLMPLDVFLVDGNIFRVPQRRVWEREGTKGLLSWLRGRIE